jgi:signal transduction histidine kinase/CheY-like chemotaxis protein
MTIEKLIAKRTLNELFKNTYLPLAALDKDKKILWFNDEFKSLTSASKLKGRNLHAVFNSIPENFGAGKKNLEFIINSRNDIVKINELKNGKIVDGYFITIEKDLNRPEKPNKTFTIFQNEFGKTLNFLVKEKSLNALTENIINSCLKIISGNFGIVVFHDDRRDVAMVIADGHGILKNKDEIKKELSQNYSFIVKWLIKNKHSLVAENKSENIGYNLAKVLSAKTLLVAPCFFDNSLVASLILGGKSSYSDTEINYVEQLAALLSFAVSSIRVRELNETLKTRLLQSQKLETIGKLSSGIAHDFNNLLSSIFGSLELLKKKIPESETVTRLLDNIENCSIRARELTKGLLSYGKPTAKRKEPIKINELLSELVKVITQTFPKKITLKTSIEDNLKNSLGNSTEIYQVLLNLCVNAKEAIQGNGSITISANNFVIDDKNNNEYPTIEPGDYIRISVKDDGSGIDEENINRIFDPYFSTKEKTGGSGLGLYVVYGIIKAHNGNIEVSSKINVGTEFDIYLPVYEESKGKKLASKEKIILLADDEEMLRDLLSDLLESKGYSVIRVGSSLETLRVLTEEIKVDLVIIDYNMPQMNGIECVQKIREYKFDMPIILSTGSLTVEENFDPEKTGINRLLSKPYEFKTMLATIEELI